jgi:hypothetical protein
MGGGWLDLYDAPASNNSGALNGFDSAHAVGFGPGVRALVAVPVLAADGGAVWSAAVEGRGARAVYGQAPTTARLVDSNAGTGTGLVDDGDVADLSYSLHTYGYGVALAVGAGNFYGQMSAGTTRGAVTTTLNGRDRTTRIRGQYFAVTPGVRVKVNRHLHLLASAEALMHPSGLVAEDPSVAFPLSDQLAIPATQFTALVGFRVDI